MLMSKKPETLEECQAKIMEMARLLLEARDALPAISFTSAKLRGIRLDLADRIEASLEPWRVE